MRIAILLTGLSITLAGAGAGTASAADCGGGSGFNRVACDCGDTVVKSTTLQRSDPVVNNICPDDGLIIGADRIVLDCANRTLTGDGDEDGINLDGRSRVTVTRCHITAFEDGISLDDSNKNKIRSNVIFQNTTDGVEIDGDSDGNFVGFNKIKDNEQDGIDLDSDDDGESAPDRNTIQSNFVSGNGADGSGSGIEDCDDCTGNKYIYNTVQKTLSDGGDNDGDGIDIKGTDNVIRSNRGSQNSGTGLIVVGEDNTVSANRFNSNGQNGICVEEGNRAGLRNSGRNNIGANVVFDAVECPAGLVANASIASAALTTSSATADDDDD